MGEQKRDNASETQVEKQWCRRKPEKGETLAEKRIGKNALDESPPPDVGLGRRNIMLGKKKISGSDQNKREGPNFEEERTKARREQNDSCWQCEARKENRSLFVWRFAGSALKKCKTAGPATETKSSEEELARRIKGDRLTKKKRSYAKITRKCKVRESKNKNGTAGDIPAKIPGSGRTAPQKAHLKKEGTLCCNE